MRFTALALALAVAATACGTDTDGSDSKDTDGVDTEETDSDGESDEPDPTTTDLDLDGFTADVDCDDTNDAIFPGAVESCDGIDNDCDETIDGPNAVDASDFWADADADGYGDSKVSVRACVQPEGYVDRAADCDDTLADVNPAGIEVCDGIDQDCDNDIDDGVLLDWYQDADGDGFGNLAETLKRCEAPKSYVADATDCDDAVAEINPAAPEICNAGVDDNCDSVIDDDDPFVGERVTFFQDADGDTHGDESVTVQACLPPAGFVALDDDCDDNNVAISPSAIEICNGTDDDCDSVTDPSSSADAGSWYVDADLDGFGDASAIAVLACEGPEGSVLDNTDCDDAVAEINPTSVWFQDADGDGFGNESLSVTACLPPVSTATLQGGDCNDTAANINPETVWFADSDGDGFGDAASGTTVCEQPIGTVLDDQDCDDADIAINPNTEWFADADGDGFGDDATALVQCAQPELTSVIVGGDCVDGDAFINPNTIWFEDADGDGFGDPLTETVQCDAPTITSVLVGTDCNDGDLAINPETSWFADVDGDGFGDAASFVVACVAPDASSVLDDQDCDDADATTNPETVWFTDADGDGFGSELIDAAIQCDAPDVSSVRIAGDCDDADATTNPETSWFTDADGDGFGSDLIDAAIQCDAPDVSSVRVAGDCDDADATTNPETSWYTDADGDGFGSDLIDAAIQCDAPDVSSVRVAGDCDDADATTNPQTSWYTDADGDGFGSDLIDAAIQCDAPDVSSVRVAGDCDDADATTNPQTSWYTDADGDGFGSDLIDAAIQCDAPDVSSVRVAGDCDDADATTNPQTSWYTDADGDGYGSDLIDAAIQCDAPDVSSVRIAGDCDDADAGTNPELVWFADADSDGFGDVSSTTESCLDPSSGGAAFVSNADDCDDADAGTGVASDWYFDNDGDGVFVANSSVVACDDPSTPSEAYSATPGDDCDDNDLFIYPGAPELCDGVDQDCDGDPEGDDGWAAQDFAARQVLTFTEPVSGAIPVRFGFDKSAAYASISEPTPADATGDISFALQDCDTLSGATAPMALADGIYTSTKIANSTQVVGLLDADAIGDGEYTFGAAAGEIPVGAYFFKDGSGAVSSPGDVVTSTSGMSNGLVSITLDAAAGGLISDFTAGSTSLFSQSGTTAGNGLFVSGAWQSASADAAPTVSVVLDTPSVGIVVAQGTIPTIDVDYTYTYTLFEGVNEVFVDVLFVAGSNVTVTQNGGLGRGVRPFYVSADYFIANGYGTFASDATDSVRAWHTSADASFAIAYNTGLEPAFAYNAPVFNQGLGLAGSDTRDLSAGVDVSYLAGETIVDTSLTIAGYEGDFDAAAQARFDEIIAGVSPVAGSFEAR